MTMTTPETVAGEVLVDLAACLCATLETEGLPEPCFCGVMPGAQVALDYSGCFSDDCGGNGMAWVRLAGFYQANGPGALATQAGQCGVGLGVDIEVGVIRCISAGENDGSPPSAADMLAASLLQYADMAAMRKAFLCCTTLSLKDTVIGQYTPIGPQGGIVGGTWQIFTVVF